MKCLFVSDLHGQVNRYKTLFEITISETPDAVFLGGDLLPNHVALKKDMTNFLNKTIFVPLQKIHEKCTKHIRFFVILGNDDPRVYESYFEKADNKKILSYVHCKTVPFGNQYVTGYAYVPPTPFLLKDWERYDVSRFVDVGAVPPESGTRTLPVSPDEIRDATMANDLEHLAQNAPVEHTIFLFHAPPYHSSLDLADLHGKMVDHAPLDTHIGSIAIQRFIENRQPLLTLHGHAHETARLSGQWKEKIGNTYCFSAAHDGPELALVRFDTTHLQHATREILTIT